MGKVVDLIDIENGSWNKELVEQTIDEEERGLILNTLCSKCGPEDRWFWWPCSNGIYTVRSGYWLAKLGHIRSWFNKTHEQERA
ncbi:putative N-acetylmannosamine-6-phosphate 2-epimerase [Bienertia sinuspersici]